MKRTFGTPDGVRIGDIYINRRDLHDSGVHRPLQAGISGTRAEGADSVVLSGGYEDEDHGDYLVYSGHGGRDGSSGRQIADQSPDAPGNAGLITSMVAGLPVRVIRGPHGRSPYAPTRGYQYAGLFAVAGSWIETTHDGFRIVRFRLERLTDQPPLFSKVQPELDPAFVKTTVTRRVRDTALSREVKAIYGNYCQICQSAIPGFGDRSYSEGAHVRPLGRPHVGEDALDNLLCLCPNHHTQLDIGGMVIQDDFSVVFTRTLVPFADLRFHPDHSILVTNVRYQRELWLPPARRMSLSNNSRVSRASAA